MHNPRGTRDRLSEQQRARMVAALMQASAGLHALASAMASCARWEGETIPSQPPTELSAAQEDYVNALAFNGYTIEAASESLSELAADSEDGVAALGALNWHTLAQWLEALATRSNASTPAPSTLPDPQGDPQ